MDATLIPFALREVDQRFVGVVDVASGLACGCICPSCKSRLIARKGNVKVWHFAHVSRADGHQIETDCDYSWVVSVRLMARQLLGDGLDLDLPAVTDSVQTADRWGQMVRHTYPVAPAHGVAINQPQLDVPFAGALVDVLASVAGQPFVIYFTHAGRPLPETLKAPTTPCAGVVSISLGQHALGVENTTAGLDDRQRLTDFLTSHLASKAWVYHPDMPDKRPEELDQLKARLSAQHQAPHLRNWHSPVDPPVVPPRRYALIEATPGEALRYVCVNCDFRWGDSMGDRSPCPQCGSLYMTTHIR
jgi:Competence protein CoiA-like family